MTTTLPLPIDSAALDDMYEGIRLQYEFLAKRVTFWSLQARDEDQTSGQRTMARAEVASWSKRRDALKTIIDALDENGAELALVAAE